MPSRSADPDHPPSPAASAEAHVRVLLATYNGERWIDEQLASLQAQRGVRISIVASDDASGDDTAAALDRWAQRIPLIRLDPPARPSGSAHRNFMRLIRDTPLDDASHFALCDQDDVWDADKLQRAVAALHRDDADGYSGNVTAWWPDGREHVVRKSRPQRRYDHLFESPGRDARS